MGVDRPPFGHKREFAARWYTQVVPDVIAMTACMDALAAGGKWSEAIKILDDMRSRGITPNERTYKVWPWLIRNALLRQ